VRNHTYFCRLEKYISTIDLQLIRHLVGFKSDAHAAAWCSKIHEMTLVFKYPLRRFMNYLSSSDCTLNYYDMWRLLKHLNTAGLNEINELKF
jgi:hypothetical protein